MKKLFTGICIILILASVSIYPDKKTNNDGDVQLLPKGVYILQLDNGLKVLLIENPALPMVGINVVVKVGSAYETFATSGMSHMLEHLLFNGTNSRTQKQLYDDTDRIGGYNNANTSEYYTNYMMVTPADNIVNGMGIQADMLFNSILPEAKFQKEKGIVLEEISKSFSSPAERINRNLISILYKGHALSLPTLGTYATIEAMKKVIVYDFYKKNSVKSNSFKLDDYLLIVGEQLDIQQRAEILNLQRKIKETTKEIIKVNQQNKYIIIQARTLLNEIVSAIFSERNNSLLDRKV